MGRIGDLLKKTDAKKRREQLLEKYMECVEKRPVDKKCVLLESQQGASFDGSIYFLAEELSGSQAYKDYEIYLVCRKEYIPERRDYLKWHKMNRIKLVEYGENRYYELLATAGKLINDGTFMQGFIKRKEQVYAKIWDTIPLGRIGRGRSVGYAAIGNIQKNLMCADYLICPNEYTVERLAREYMIENICEAKALLPGRLQTALLFATEQAQEIKRRYQAEEKQIFFYSPLGVSTGQSLKKINLFLKELDARLRDDQIVFCNFSFGIRNNVDFASLKHMVSVPEDETPYFYMASSDALITDNPGIAIDYAVTKRKIILYSYAGREIFEELPFSRPQSIEELLQEMDSGINYDAEEFNHKYIPYCRQDAASELCRTIVLGEECPKLATAKIPDNGKKNILIYPGALAKNGITSAINSLLYHLDRSKTNYIIFYRMEVVKNREECLRDLPEGVSFYGYTPMDSLWGEEAKLYRKWVAGKKLPYEKVKNALYKRASFENERLLSFCRIDGAVHYDGYGEDIMLLFELLPCKRVIYVHNDMISEIKKKKSVHREVLSHAYRSFDAVAVVSEEQRAKTEIIASGQKRGDSGKAANIVEAKNVINVEHVLQFLGKRFQIDASTSMNVEEQELRRILTSGAKLFITVGRFSAEKGHMRLIEAFDKFHEEYPDTYLIILGGYGVLYDKTCKKAAQMKSADHIVVICYLSNPFPLLKQCSFFVLPSFYEGLPVVITEADLVGLPCFSTDIPGPGRFMRQYGGRLVENSKKGIYEGLKACMAGEIPSKLTLDYEKYNEEAISQFETMMSCR